MIDETDSEVMREWMENNVFHVEDAAEHIGLTRSGLDSAKERGSIEPVLYNLYFRSDLDRYRANVKAKKPYKNRCSLTNK